MPETEDLLATRTVVMCFPDGGSQYWLTDKVFTAGETIERDGRRWVVSHVAGSRETGREPRVTLREVKREALPSADPEALDQVAWNLPNPAA
jgi:hypothetical protein